MNIHFLFHLFIVVLSSMILSCDTDMSHDTPANFRVKHPDEAKFQRYPQAVVRCFHLFNLANMKLHIWKEQLQHKLEKRWPIRFKSPGGLTKPPTISTHPSSIKTLSLPTITPSMSSPPPSTITMSSSPPSTITMSSSSPSTMSSPPAPTITTPAPHTSSITTPMPPKVGECRSRDKSFYMSPESVYWEEAARSCRDHGKNRQLAVISTEEESDAILKCYVDNGEASEKFWISGLVLGLESGCDGSQPLTPKCWYWDDRTKKFDKISAVSPFLSWHDDAYLKNQQKASRLLFRTSNVKLDFDVNTSTHRYLCQTSEPAL